MAIHTNQPIEQDGKTYDKFAINLALSPMRHDDGYGASIAVRLTPYCVTENGPENLEAEVKAIVYGDAMVAASSDPDLLAFLMALEAAGQAFIDAKGL
jgi:hypothetical protein